MTFKVKKCPHCGSYETIPLTSTNERICNGCKKTFEWKLDKGQKAPLEDGKVG